MIECHMLICCPVIWMSLCGGNSVAGLPVMPSHILLKTSPTSSYTLFSMQTITSLTCTTTCTFHRRPHTIGIMVPTVYRLLMKSYIGSPVVKVWIIHLHIYQLYTHIVHTYAGTANMLRWLCMCAFVRTLERLFMHLQMQLALMLANVFIYCSQLLAMSSAWPACCKTHTCQR